MEEEDDREGGREGKDDEILCDVSMADRILRSEPRGRRMESLDDREEK